MKRPILCFFLMLTFSRYAAPQTKADEAAVQQIPKAFVSAWATHEGHRLAKLMSDDVDFVNVGGDWMHGRPDFELYHTRLLAGPFKASNLTVLDAAVHFIRPDLAVLHWTWSIKGDGEEDPRTHAPRRGIFTMLVQKRGDAWLIAVAQNTNERPGPNPELDGIKPLIAFPPTR
jgi:uncharacterized protein (TIGR02246 family)